MIELDLEEFYVQADFNTFKILVAKVLVRLSNTLSSLVQGVRQPRTPGCCCLLALNTADCCSNPFVFDPNNEDANPGSGALQGEL